MTPLFKSSLLILLAVPVCATDFTLAGAWQVLDTSKTQPERWSAQLNGVYPRSQWRIDAEGTWRQQAARPQSAIGATTPVIQLGWAEDGSPWQLDLQTALTLSLPSDTRHAPTSKNDWSLSTSLRRSYGPYQFSWTGGYSWISSPMAQSGRNVWNSDVYLGYETPRGLGMGLDYAWSQHPQAGYEPTRSVSLMGYMSLGESGQLGINLMRGLTEEDAVQDIAITYRYRFR